MLSTAGRHSARSRPFRFTKGVVSSTTNNGREIWSRQPYVPRIVPQWVCRLSWTHPCSPDKWTCQTASWRGHDIPPDFALVSRAIRVMRGVCGTSALQHLDQHIVAGLPVLLQQQHVVVT
jgi:hypothetical protein